MNHGMGQIHRKRKLKLTYKWMESRWHNPQKVVYMGGIYSEAALGTSSLSNQHKRPFSLLGSQLLPAANEQKRRTYYIRA